MRAYKRICFHGRGILARWLDRVFFSALAGTCLFILQGRFFPACTVFLTALTLFVIWDRKHWNDFWRETWQKAVRDLKREDWLRQEAKRIRECEGVILYPTPNREELTGYCLRTGKGTAFHCFGEPQQELIDLVSSLGCSIFFHPWQEGMEPSREKVMERLHRDAPQRKRRIWCALLQVSGSRYLLAGSLLLMASVFLRHAIYWRCMGTVCLMIGAVKRTFGEIAK